MCIRDSHYRRRRWSHCQSRTVLRVPRTVAIGFRGQLRLDIRTDRRRRSGGTLSLQGARDRGHRSMRRYWLLGAGRFLKGDRMKWITRERPKIDRIACPWLVARFIDQEPEFLYVPSGDVLTVADETNAIPYDIPGVELTHEGDLCSFDAFLKKYELDDPAL